VPETVIELLERAYAAGLTQRQIADALGVTDRTLRRWAAGDGDIKLSAYQSLVALLQGAQSLQ